MVVNRFNGLERSTGIFRKPLKRLQDFMHALNPQAKARGE
jgi:hypothetical protein